MNKQLPLDMCISDGERFGITTCGYCNAIIMQEQAVVSVFYDGDDQQQEHFCGENLQQCSRVRLRNMSSVIVLEKNSHAQRLSERSYASDMT